MRRLLVVVLFLFAMPMLDPPNPACLVPFPYHCDPPPK